VVTPHEGGQKVERKNLETIMKTKNMSWICWWRQCMASATKAAKKLMIMNSENPISVEEGLSGMNLRCIENLYGENGIELRIQEMHCL
jgi:hypothetical protein